MFDIWLVICQSAGLIINLQNKVPTWVQLVSTAAILPKIERRKLIIRYHPDKLTTSLGRSPTDNEIKMSNMAMSILNLLFHDNRYFNEKSVMSALTDLNVIYNKTTKPPPPRPAPEPKPKPKRKLTTYNKFVSANFAEVRAKTPNIRPVDVIREIAKIWRELSEDQKKEFAKTVA